MKRVTPAGGTLVSVNGPDGSPLLELNAGGAVTAVNTFGANGLISRSAGGASTYYQHNPMGHVAARLSNNGSVLSDDL